MTPPPPRWLARSVRHKLLAMALLPLLVALPLLLIAVAMWSAVAYDRLLITKVRSDLAVARGYFDQLRSEVGGGVRGVAASAPLLAALESGRPVTASRLQQERRTLGLDFLVLLSPSGEALGAADPVAGAIPASLWSDVRAQLQAAVPAGTAPARLKRWRADELAPLAPHLLPRLSIPLVPTRNAAPDERSREQRALVLLSVHPVTDLQGRERAVLVGGVLLNQNLGVIDHINRIVYPDGSLPFGSQGTATLFLDDVRITTNVRLFQDQRAIGTRVSQAVRERVLTQGQTWLDRAFVVNDWYVSAYEPLADARGQRIGMLYVGFLEQPFRWVRWAMLGAIGLIFLAVMAASGWLSVRWARSIFRPVERMNDTMRAVELGDPSARVGPLPAQDELGALAGHLDQLLDVIDDKTQALQRWGQELDAKVAERTRDLAQSHASLERAQAQLVKSEKLAAIGQLTASVAHEINNPIAVMQGNLDLIRETLGAQANPVRDELKLLDEQVERMRLIVTQLLQYARPTEYAGYVDTLDVNRVMTDCLVLVGHLLHQSGISVERDCQARHPVGMNRQELQQVVINLLINAIQAMPGGGTLTLRTRDWATEDSAHAGAELQVQDSGPGLSAEAQERLFRPFFTTKNDGNGLGLWISQGLVERYGGTLSGANRSDGASGAAFTVRLLTEPQAPAAVDTRDGRPGLAG